MGQKSCSCSRKSGRVPVPQLEGKYDHLSGLARFASLPHALRALSRQLGPCVDICQLRDWGDQVDRAIFWFHGPDGLHVRTVRKIAQYWCIVAMPHSRPGTQSSPGK